MKKIYESPKSTVIEMNTQQALLTGSDLSLTIDSDNPGSFDTAESHEFDAFELLGY